MQSILKGSIHQLPHPVGPQVPNPDYDPSDINKRNLPQDIDKEKLTRAEDIVFKEHVCHYIKATYKLKEDMEWAYVVLIGQCTDELIVKLETYDSYERVNIDNDIIAMLNLIQ